MVVGKRLVDRADGRRAGGRAGERAGEVPGLQENINQAFHNNGVTRALLQSI